MSENEKVELRPAFAWDCPECGREQFHRGLVPEMDEEDKEELKEKLGIDPDDEGCFLAMPKNVVCGDCFSKFEALHYEE